MNPTPFNYHTLEEVAAHAAALGVDLPLSKQTAGLAQPLATGRLSMPNRLLIQPMEGCDGTGEGEPGFLTRRRYQRFAGSGAGLIWVEACAVAPEGRANPRQLMLTDRTLDAFKALCADIRETARRETGLSPVLIL